MLKNSDLSSDALRRLDSILQKVVMHCNGTISQKSIHLLAYSDDIDIKGHIKRDITAAFSAIERETTKMSLAVDKGKTKYSLSYYQQVETWAE